MGGRAALIVGILVLAAAIGAAVYWFGFASRGQEVHYTTAPATVGTVERSVSTSGTVNPVLTVTVGTYVSGVITQLYCDYNTQVTKGQICAQIDPRPYQTAVDQAKAELATARAQLSKDQANLANLKSVYERNAGLLKRGIVSQETFESSKAAYDQAGAQVKLDQATIEQRSAALDAAQVNLEYTHIRSPVDGTVVSRNVTVGQTVAASFQTPTLFLIATDLTKMQVDCNVSESDIGEVKKDDRAQFTVEAYPGRTFEGNVVQVRQAPQTVQNVVTYDVVVAVSNNDLALKPGMTATARIIVAQRENVLRVPDQALRFSPGFSSASQGAASGASANTGSRVWVLRDGKPVAVPVKVGIDDGTQAEIAQGALRAGEQVITGEARPGQSGRGRSPSGPRFF